MRICVTSLEEIFKGSNRIDAKFHASEGVSALRAIRSKFKYDKLSSICIPNGIFIGDRSKRIYVENKEQGIPFLSSSDMLNGSFEGSKLISINQPGIDRLLLEKGWILVSRSGTIGKVAYTRDDMVGLAGSEHIMRVVPNNDKVLPGYLYAFLSSSIGESIITSGTYGSVVDTISTRQVGQILIPRLTNKIELKIHGLIEQASIKWTQAGKLLNDARSNFDYLDTLEIKTRFPHDFDINIINSKHLNDRLGAHYHSSLYQKIEKMILSGEYIKITNLVIQNFAPPPFKHIYLDEPNDFPFLTGGELRKRKSTNIRYLSELGVNNIEDYIIKTGWLALFKSGSLDSMFGSVFYITKELNNYCLSDHVIRLEINPNILLPEYVYAFLSSRVGRLLIVRRATGTAVPFVREDSISSIPIPVLSDELMCMIAEKVENAFKLRSMSLDLEATAQRLIQEELGLSLGHF